MRFLCVLLGADASFTKAALRKTFSDADANKLYNRPNGTIDAVICQGYAAYHRTNINAETKLSIGDKDVWGTVNRKFPAHRL